MQEIVKTYQNIACLIVCSIVSSTLLHNALYGNDLEFPIPFLVVFSLVDMFFCKPDLILHHICCLCIFAFKILSSCTSTNTPLLIHALYATEISTIFLCIESLFMNSMHPIVRIINKTAFITTFFKFRIYDYYFTLIVNPTAYQQLAPYTDTITKTTLVYTGIYGLSILNFYWFTILCKIIFKSVRPMILGINVRLVLPYISFLNIFIISYVYSFSPKFHHIPDILGMISLSIASYKFHMILKNTKGINFVSPEILRLFLQDTICIHIRCVTCCVTAAYTSSYFPHILLISLINHGTSLYTFVRYITETNKTTDVIVYHEDNEVMNTFMMHTYILISIPISFDIFIAGYLSNNYITSINLFFTSIIILFLLKLKPFYECNHLVLHLLLLVLSYYLASCNL